jgi:single-stranded-DNA-specific exonuclease
VIGIVASRLKDKFYRPTITFAPGDEGFIKGSGRSIPGFHLRDALDLVSKHALGDDQVRRPRHGGRPDHP